jgi:DNA-binding MarR family transcriptional regulator
MARRAPHQRNGSAIDLATLPHHVGYAIRRAQVAIFQHIIRAMESLDVRPGQFSVLTVIGANPGLKQIAISEALDIRRANWVGMINGLERRGWIERRAVRGDRRAQGLYLTPRGRATLSRLRSLAARHERTATRLLTAAEKRQLLRLLARVHDATA